MNINNLDKKIFKNPDNKEKELITFFEQKGFTNLKKFDNDNTNYFFIGEKDGEECFIKIFNRPQVDGVDVNIERIGTEIDCYKNLPPDMLIDYIEGSKEDNYIVLRKVELEDLERSKQSLKKMMDLGLKDFAKIDASFLPETTWESYEDIFKKIDILENAGIIEDAKDIKELFSKRREIIENSKKRFSHLDFNFLNIKKLNDKVVPFDFEIAKQDNAMVDMGILYIEISDDEKLVEEFEKNIKESDLYNEQLLKLMIIRRCIILLYACMDFDTPIVRKNKKVLNDVIKKEKLFE